MRRHTTSPRTIAHRAWACSCSRVQQRRRERTTSEARSIENVMLRTPSAAGAGSAASSVTGTIRVEPGATLLSPERRIDNMREPRHRCGASQSSERGHGAAAPTSGGKGKDMDRGRRYGLCSTRMRNPHERRVVAETSHHVATYCYSHAITTGLKTRGLVHNDARPVYVASGWDRQSCLGERAQEGERPSNEWRQR
jgi:hypothetical protein